MRGVEVGRLLFVARTDSVCILVVVYTSLVVSCDRRRLNQSSASMEAQHNTAVLYLVHSIDNQKGTKCEGLHGQGGLCNHADFQCTTVDTRLQQYYCCIRLLYSTTSMPTHFVLLL